MGTNQSKELRINDKVVEYLRNRADVYVLVVPTGVEKIGSSVFQFSSTLTYVRLPESLTGLGDFAFRGCAGLTSLMLPESLTEVGASAFRSCTGLTSLTLPGSMTVLGDTAFAECTGLTSVILPESLTSVVLYSYIGDRVFEDCDGLASVVFPPRSTPCFVCFALSNMRNRANWELTTVKQLRNVLRLITAFAVKRRDAVFTMDPHGSKGVFRGCHLLPRVQCI